MPVTETAVEPCVVMLTRWVDPLVDGVGFDALSAYAETFWLPVLGPTATLMLRRFARLVGNGGSVSVDLGDVAAGMGLAYQSTRSSAFTKALQRLTMFGLAHVTAGGLAVRTTVPVLSARHLRRLPVLLQVEHDRAVASAG